MALKQLKSKMSLIVIKISRKLFINTWVHDLPITEKIYKKVFYFGRDISEQEIIFMGRKLKVHTKDISIVPSLLNQEFEEYELKVFKKLLKPNNTLLDVGANIGIYSIFASDIIKSKGTIYAFEPVPENFNLLKENLKLNNCINVNAMNCGIGAKKSVVKISIVKDSLAEHYIGSGEGETIDVPIETIDSIVSKNKLHVDIIKMDIEGYEGYALDGAKKTLINKNIILFIEFSEEFVRRSGKNPEIVAKQLLDVFKYRYCISEKSNKLIVISTSSEILNKSNNNFVFSHRPINIKV